MKKRTPYKVKGCALTGGVPKAVYEGEKLLAYCDTEGTAQLIVHALNFALGYEPTPPQRAGA